MLFWAARAGHDDVVRLLLDGSADPMQQNVQGDFALYDDHIVDMRNARKRLVQKQQGIARGRGTSIARELLEEDHCQDHESARRRQYSSEGHRLIEHSHVSIHRH